MSNPFYSKPILRCFFPFFGYARCRDQTVLTTTDYGDSPHGDYHDFLAMAIAASRIPWDRIQRARLAIACKQKATIVKNSEASLRELKHRLDQMNSVMRLDGIPLNCFMGHTFNHPSAALLNELYSSIWAKTLNYSPSSFTPVDGEPFANDGQLPVMDFIVEALQKSGILNIPLPRNAISRDAYEEILKKSIRFYLKTQEIVETNMLHPKMRLAKKFLNLGLMGS